MDPIALSGSHYEIGRQVGEIIKPFFKPTPVTEKTIQFIKECEDEYRRHAPGILEEVDGLIDASELEEASMKAFLLSLGLEQMCTIFTLSGENTDLGVPVFARNYDWDVTFQPFFTIYSIKSEGGLRHLLFTDHFIGGYGGVNEEGLALGITAIPAYRNEPQPGVRMNMAVKWILETCTSTDEAVNYLKKTPHQWAHNYLIADKEGTQARVESAPQRDQIVYAEDGFITATNHYQTEEMKPLETEPYDYSNTHQRYNHLVTWNNERSKPVSVEDVMQVLSSHEGSVCNHGEYMGKMFGTIWSWIAPLGLPYVYMSSGPPCKNRYKKIEI